MATPINKGGLTNPISRLILQSKKPIDFALCGAEETTLEYILKNESYPDLVPALGASPADVTPAVAGISAFAHLGKETHRFIHNGKAPGIGILQVKYRGARIGEDPISTEPEVTYTYSLLGLSVPYVYEDATAGNADTPSTRSLSYRAIARRFHYVHNEAPTTPLFALQGIVTPAPVFDEPGFDPEDIIPLPDGRVYSYGSIWALTEFTIVPCGRFFEVTEADQAKIVESIS